MLFLHCTGAAGDDLLVPRCQLRQGTGSHFCIRKTLQQVFQIFIDIQAMCPGHLNHSVYGCAGLSPFRGVTEQPVFAPHCKRTDRILGKVVGKAAPAIFQVCHELLLMVLGIVHRLLKAGSFFWCLR